MDNGFLWELLNTPKMESEDSIVASVVLHYISALHNTYTTIVGACHVAMPDICSSICCVIISVVCGLQSNG